MEITQINATRRTEIGKKVKALRRNGGLPAVIYGHNLAPLAITLDMREASRIISSLTSSSLVKIVLEGEELTALVRDKQRNYLKGQFLHVDFQAVSMTEKIRAFVQIVTVGVSPAVQNFNAIVEQLMNEIEVECLPGDLPEKIQIDVSGLNSIGDHILVKDLKVSDAVQIHTNPEETVVSITSATMEEIEEKVAEEVTAAEPEVIERGKKEEETED